ncbi:unnamed protein product (macronuclear) [Paramecium tetraurelia]|uniref:Transmembrane protein n=1 Tax=Paramecium tetraurelia TaxID=5888 RepID=A0BUZ9_PARTE|nr:uncharacterized protein GSPATT00005612001 [Paramecium tetraurelia]CAK62366.1 unnamed protein product [Paramecium tetraurelia]|eukprot:XP_001429764.1 hypothetical protein (macronuclear) [Paramecium tetraurelia strain d4-2]
MYYNQNAPVHQYSPIKTIPVVPSGYPTNMYPQPIPLIYQAQSYIQPSQSYSNVRYTQNAQPLKQSALSTFQPYRPDPEVEKIISKYTATSRNSQIEQPVTHQPSNSIQQNSKNQINYKHQNSNEDLEFKDMHQDNNTPLHFQFDEIKQRKPNQGQNNYSPDIHEFQDFSPQKQKQVALPEQNDKIVKLIVSGIIVLLVLYIISILVLI